MTDHSQNFSFADISFLYEDLKNIITAKYFSYIDIDDNNEIIVSLHICT